MKKHKSEISKLIGLKVIYIKGGWGKKGNSIEPEYILFNDGKTYIQIKDQDYRVYRDCSSLAKYLFVKQDEFRWDILKTVYPNANIDICS